jgi:hypothetical protein
VRSVPRKPPDRTGVGSRTWTQTASHWCTAPLGCTVISRLAPAVLSCQGNQHHQRLLRTTLINQDSRFSDIIVGDGWVLVEMSRGEASIAGPFTSGFPTCRLGSRYVTDHVLPRLFMSFSADNRLVLGCSGQSSQVYTSSTWPTSVTRGVPHGFILWRGPRATLVCVASARRL